MALIKRYPEEKLDHIDLKQSCWAQSLFRRMGFVRRLGTTGKVPIPDSLKKELEKSYLHGIIKKIEDNDIPPSLVEKRMITATIILDGHFLPVQLIYGGKTLKGLPRVNFPKSFSLRANPKYYSNEQGSIKALEEIIIPYVKKERERLGMEKDQAALLIRDVFKGQKTRTVLKVLSNNNILLQSVPANFIYLFQPLDVQGGPNGFVKRLMKRKFTDWYASQITLAMEEDKELETIEVPLILLHKAATRKMAD